MVAANCSGITVPGKYDHLQFGFVQFDASRPGKRSPMNAVKDFRIQINGNPRSAADTADGHQLIEVQVNRISSPDKIIHGLRRPAPRTKKVR